MPFRYINLNYLPIVNSQGHRPKTKIFERLPNFKQASFQSLLSGI